MCLVSYVHLIVFFIMGERATLKKLIHYVGESGDLYDVLGDTNIAYCLVRTVFRSPVVSLRLFAQHT